MRVKRTPGGSTKGLAPQGHRRGRRGGLGFGAGGVRLRLGGRSGRQLGFGAGDGLGLGSAQGLLPLPQGLLAAAVARLEDVVGRTGEAHAGLGGTRERRIRRSLLRRRPGPRLRESGGRLRVAAAGARQHRPGRAGRGNRHGPAALGGEGRVRCPGRRAARRRDLRGDHDGRGSEELGLDREDRIGEDGVGRPRRLDRRNDGLGRAGCDCLRHGSLCPGIVCPGILRRGSCSRRSCSLRSRGSCGQTSRCRISAVPANSPAWRACGVPGAAEAAGAGRVGGACQGDGAACGIGGCISAGSGAQPSAGAAVRAGRGAGLAAGAKGLWLHGSGGVGADTVGSGASGRTRASAIQLGVARRLKV